MYLQQVTIKIGTSELEATVIKFCEHIKDKKNLHRRRAHTQRKILQTH